MSKQNSNEFIFEKYEFVLSYDDNCIQVLILAHGAMLNQEISIKLVISEPLDQFKKSMLPSKTQVLTSEEQSISKIILSLFNKNNFEFVIMLLLLLENDICSYFCWFNNIILLFCGVFKRIKD